MSRAWSSVVVKPVAARSWPVAMGRGEGYTENARDRVRRQGVTKECTQRGDADDTTDHPSDYATPCSDDAHPSVAGQGRLPLLRWCWFEGRHVDAGLHQAWRIARGVARRGARRWRGRRLRAKQVRREAHRTELLVGRREDPCYSSKQWQGTTQLGTRRTPHAPLRPACHRVPCIIPHTPPTPCTPLASRHHPMQPTADAPSNPVRRPTQSTRHRMQARRQRAFIPQPYTTPQATHPARPWPHQEHHKWCTPLSRHGVRAFCARRQHASYTSFMFGPCQTNSLQKD